MQNENLYRIIFAGKIKEGEDLSQVKARMASLFKVDAAVIEKVFRDAPTMIQRNLTRENALKYKEAVEKNGALCRIEKEISISTPPPPVPEPVQPSPRESGPQPQLYTPTAAHKQIEEPANEFAAGVRQMNKDAWKSLGTGLVIAAVILSFPFLSFVFRYVITLVHEIGHAVFGWLFGYPSVPAFDFTYGGGITMHQDRRIFIVIIVYLLFAGLFYLYRKNHLTIFVLVTIVALYTVSAFTSIHSFIILFMGHGTELIFAAIFFYRALGGSSVIIHAERPLYAFLGFFILFIDIRFAHRLMTSASYRAEYGAAKGGGHWMDFSRIAEEYLNIKLSTAASLFLVLCLITPLITFLFFRYKNYASRFFLDGKKHLF
jgi:hypothetical protein